MEGTKGEGTLGFEKILCAVFRCPPYFPTASHFHQVLNFHQFTLLSGAMHQG